MNHSAATLDRTKPFADIVTTKHSFFCKVLLIVLLVAEIDRRNRLKTANIRMYIPTKVMTMA